MLLQERLIELVEDAGYIPILTVNEETVNILDVNKQMVGQFKIVSGTELVLSVLNRKQKKEFGCSFDEIGVLSVISQLKNTR